MPRHDYLAFVPKARLHYSVTDPSRVTDNNNATVTEQSLSSKNIRNLDGGPELSYYGVTLTVWTHADGVRASTLKSIKSGMQKSKTGPNSLSSDPVIPSGGSDTGTKPRKPLPWGMSGTASETDVSEIGTNGCDLDGPLSRKAMRHHLEDQSAVLENVQDEPAGVLQDGGDVFWLPYAVTMGAYEMKSTLILLSLSSSYLRCHAGLSSPQRLLMRSH